MTSKDSSLDPWGDECPHDRMELRRRQTGNGGWSVGWYCPDCSRWVVRPGRTGIWIPQNDTDLVMDIEDIPIQEYAKLETCGHCGEEEFCEFHHYAPRANFGDDSERWPQGWLCVNCHELWHAKMGQPIRQRRG